MNRRTYLSALSFTGAVRIAGRPDLVLDRGTETPPSSTPTSTGAPTTTSTQRRTEPSDGTQRFGTVVNMVEDQGVDRFGIEPIDAELQETAGDDTLLQFPPGIYLVSERLVLSNAHNFGIVGMGASRADVKFVHPQGFTDLFLDIRGGRNCLIRNVTVDQTDDEVTNSGIVVLNNDGILVEDLEIAGFTPSGGRGSANLITQVTSEQGVGTVRRFTSTGGGKVGVYPASYPGFFSGPQHTGTLRLVDFHLERCGSNGLYASRTEGTVQIFGGLFKNNDVAQVRLCGEGSSIRDAKVVVDTDDVENPRGTYKGVRGVWWESGHQEKTGGVIAGCNMVCRSANGRRALLHVDGTAGGMTIRDSELRVDPDNCFALYGFSPGSSGMGGTPKRPWGLNVSNVRIAGSAASGTSVRLDGRPGSRFTDVTIDQRGMDRDGIQLADSPGTRIVRGDIVTDRYPLVVRFGRTAVDRDDECTLRLQDVERLRSLTLDPPRNKMTELLDNSQVTKRVYCITRNSVPGDCGTIVLSALGDRGVYISRVECS